MNGIAAYKQNSVETTSPGQIVVLLYEGAVKFLHQAIEATEAGDIQRKGDLINRACDIIMELNTSLDMEAGGEISQNLRGLYHFMIRHLTKAHLKNDTQMMREIIDLLSNLLEGWRGVVEGQQSA
jgi:flagellar protein FliS